ncbi:TetR/AcrR family transcriptional regulator [Agromyces intestinalis]|uniref:TetR/AcrR family transcriptional regulator n=1 Tax=Agromyces intestinalis TaxID=2592652 RepID=A0A5C1YFV3_9MICO|nr:TetR/AcrR family transcriptional regulator [Agromyces intestinalis]QEO14310.1 TetR/AcrR family transcriptional regulator [Agromyces intestinalis]
MGNREDLLAGARRVILERGVAKATARDIAAEAGVSLAAIGYHFGSKDRLVTEALVEALGSGIGDDIEALVLDAREQPLLDGFADRWNRMPEVFADHREALIASVENTLRVLRDPDSNETRHLRQAIAAGHLGMAENLRAAHPDLPDAQIEAIAQLEFVLVQGLGLLWLISPDGEVPSGDALARAVAALAGLPPR